MNVEVNGRRRGAASTAHPRATDAALSMLSLGGNAVDGAVAAQAMIAVTMPDAAGLGGDMLALVRSPDGVVHAVNGTGRSPATAPPRWESDGGSSVTVPGLVDGWCIAHSTWGALPLATVLEPAIAVARRHRVGTSVIAAAASQRPRIEKYGGAGWSLLALDADDYWEQPELADLLEAVALNGRDAFYRGPAATAIAAAAARWGGTLSPADLAAHRTELADPISTTWDGGTLFVQPPSSQGVLLAMAAGWIDVHPESIGDDHPLVEATEAAFEFRDEVVAGRRDLLSFNLHVDVDRAGRRSGPRGYLHTAGVAVADRDGWVVSSLISVFDDFGSAVFVCELGIVLNNRAAGFTTGANRPRESARPVHTLAPALLVDRAGDALALATPGADGQVQTLLQVLASLRRGDASLDDVLAAPRWRSQDGSLLIEQGHPGISALRMRGHQTVPRDYGDGIFGAVVAAGIRSGEPWSAADPRRGVTKGTR